MKQAAVGSYSGISMLASWRLLFAVIVLAIAAPASVAQERARDPDRSSHEDTRQRGPDAKSERTNGRDQNAPGVLALLPGDSVTDSRGGVHGVPWLFVADASLFPDSLEINPYVTIMALADRVAQRIGEEAPGLLGR